MITNKSWASGYIYYKKVHEQEFRLQLWFTGNLEGEEGSEVELDCVCLHELRLIWNLVSSVANCLMGEIANRNFTPKLSMTSTKGRFFWHKQMQCLPLNLIEKQSHWHSLSHGVFSSEVRRSLKRVKWSSVNMMLLCLATNVVSLHSHFSLWWRNFYLQPSYLQRMVKIIMAACPYWMFLQWLWISHEYYPS